jgi:hypothetical protein
VTGEPVTRCALCIDNVASHVLEVNAPHGRTTGEVSVCWPCLDQRLDDLHVDIKTTASAAIHGSGAQEQYRLSPIAGFTVRPKPVGGR